MNCDKTLNNILFYLDNELIEIERAQFEKHLHECPQCEALYASVASTYNIILAENQVEVTPFFYHKLKIKLETKEESSVIKIFTAVLKPIAIAASVTLGILIGNGELDLLNTPENEIEQASESFTPVLPADYSLWITLNEDNGNEN
jgi:predicted anti-sigma-YlaC factor YlaD